MTLSYTSCHHAWGGRGLLILIASSRLVQDDPELHDLLTKFFKLNKAKEDLNRKSKGVSAAEAEPGESADEGETSIATNIYSQYADPNNPDTWHHYELHDAAMVISCQQGTTESDCVLAQDLNHGHGHGHGVPFLCLSDSNAEARTMYEAGVRYVIQSESLAGSAIRRQMHAQVRDEAGLFDKEKFMQRYVQLHKEDMAEEKNNKHRMQLARFM